MIARSKDAIDPESCFIDTDIAGSTAMTQALGDAGAQKVMRIHNRIVREALSAHAGKEIKHTGDGIMASFAKTSDAVNGSIQMQLETMKHNQVEPDLPSAFKNRAEFRGAHCRGQRPVRDRGAVVGAYYQ